jgi:hypothetical protein
MKFELGKLYQFSLDPATISFDNLNYSQFKPLLEDGRIFSHLIEKWIETKFSNLTRVSGCKDYDFVDDQQHKYDEKTFTKSGCSFYPSCMKGSGRTFDNQRFIEYVEDIHYIFVDNTNLPMINIIGISGNDIIKYYPNGVIPIADISRIFSTHPLSYQNTGKNRNVVDKYYTKECIAKQFSDIFKSFVSKDTVLIEPSAGNGVWLKEFIDWNVKAYDILPENDKIETMNFLHLNLNQFNSSLNFIGNPPFGRQSSLAKQFIKKMCNCTQTQNIGLILPKSFKKNSCKSTFPLDFHLVFEQDIPDNSFTINGNDHDVPCVFQIWTRKEYNREVITKQLPSGYCFVKRDENPDYSFRRVGVNAGTISTDIHTKSIQSHYFIKLNSVYPGFIEEFQKIQWKHNNTVGPKSISKQELIQELNKLFR